MIATDPPTANHVHVNQPTIPTPQTKTNCNAPRPTCCEHEFDCSPPSIQHNQPRAYCNSASLLPGRPDFGLMVQLAFGSLPGRTNLPCHASCSVQTSDRPSVYVSSFHFLSFPFPSRASQPKTTRSNHAGLSGWPDGLRIVCCFWSCEFVVCKVCRRVWFVASFIAAFVISFVVYKLLVAIANA